MLYEIDLRSSIDPRHPVRPSHFIKTEKFDPIESLLTVWINILGNIYSCAIGVVKSKTFALGRCFSTDFRSKITDQLRIFCLASIWSQTATMKLEAVKSTLL